MPEKLSKKAEKSLSDPRFSIASFCVANSSGIQSELASSLEPSQFLSFCVIAAATKKRCLPGQRSPRIARVYIPLSALGFETHAAASRLSEEIRPA